MFGTGKATEVPLYRVETYHVVDLPQFITGFQLGGIEDEVAVDLLNEAIEVSHAKKLVVFRSSHLLEGGLVAQGQPAEIFCFKNRLALGSVFVNFECDHFGGLVEVLGEGVRPQQ